MPNRGKNGGHNHVLAALADAIHASASYKGNGKGSKSGKAGGGKNWFQDGRNCPSCGDFNFGFRLQCRQCGTKLPPPARPTNGSGGTKASKGAGKGAGNGGGPWTTGKGAVAESYSSVASAATPPTPAGPKPHPTEDGSELADPTERVREIRNEEERLRRTRGQYTEHNPRMLSFIDEELQKLAAEREKLQPLEVNLQAAAGRTAHARAALAKAKEKRAAAASELRTAMEKYKQADKDVQDAESKLASAEAAATAKRTEIKLTGVEDAVDLLRQVATVQCGDEAVAAQVTAALQQIANLLGGAAAAASHAPTTCGGSSDSATGAQTTAENPPPASAEQAESQQVRHAVFAACGGNGNKSRRVDGPPTPQNPAAHASPPGGGGDGSNGARDELYAGGAVDGEVQMGNSAVADGDLLSQATNLLGDGGDDL